VRSVFAMLILAAAILLAANPAHAENRIFIIANNSDAYGVDRCLASGASCGAAAAAAYCRSREFAKAASYRRVDRDEITGAFPVSTSVCGSSGCREFVAIECAR
jgi:hypothetical protein